MGPTLIRSVTWHVGEMYTQNDHLTICMKIKGESKSKKTYNKTSDELPRFFDFFKGTYFL